MKQFINIIIFAGWTLSISALVSCMNEFEMKQSNSFTLLTAPSKECFIDYLCVKYGAFLNYHNYIEVDTKSETKICICHNNNVIAYN